MWRARLLLLRVSETTTTFTIEGGCNESLRDAGFSETRSDGVNSIVEDYEIEAQLALEQAESLKRRDLDGSMARGSDDILAYTESKQLQDYAAQNHTKRNPRLPDEYESLSEQQKLLQDPAVPTAQNRTEQDPRLPNEYESLSKEDLHDGINNGAISLKLDNESRQDKPIVP
ncbi:hypothetical protein V494_08415 [Pseudogymnoascus sp. VKM F-4513 (FW-928)]|nr:hypothetical protein V494_08415 [Pseudogymnoascus sp. VKM F-4513 (FW-928)]